MYQGFFYDNSVLRIIVHLIRIEERGELMIAIDYQDRRPLYEQIAQRFQELILRGILEPGAQMPSVRKLAVELSINPNTIQRVFALLEQQGYIYAVKGKGNFVAGKGNYLGQKQRELLSRMESLLEEGDRLGMKREDWEEKLSSFYERKETGA